MTIDEALAAPSAPRERGGFHWARLESSPRLQRLLRFLVDSWPAWRTTRDVVHGAEVMAVSAATCELDRNGLHVDCRRTPEGAFEYRLADIAAARQRLAALDGGRP